MVSSASLTNYDTKQTLPYNSCHPSTASASSVAPANSRMTSSSINNLSRNMASFKRNSITASYSKHDSIAHLATSGHRFNTSVMNNLGDFYFRNLLHYVRSGNLDNYMEKVNSVK